MHHLNAAAGTGGKPVRRRSPQGQRAGGGLCAPRWRGATPSAHTAPRGQGFVQRGAPIACHRRHDHLTRAIGARQSGSACPARRGGPFTSANCTSALGNRAFNRRSANRTRRSTVSRIKAASGGET